MASPFDTPSAPAAPSQPLPASIRASGLRSPLQAKVEHLSTEELAQALMERLTLIDGHWHQKKTDRSTRAQEQVAAALVYLLRHQPAEALPRLSQAVGWLDRSLSAPPCPSHGDR